MGMNSSKFVKQIQKRDIKKMLDGELNDNLSYHKHEKSTTSNSRNDYSQKKVRTSLGESEIEVSRNPRYFKLLT